MCNVSNNSTSSTGSTGSTGQYSAELSSTVQHLSSTEQAVGWPKVHKIARALVSWPWSAELPFLALYLYLWNWTKWFTGWGFKAILRWLQSVHHQMKNLSKTHYCTYFKCGTIATADCPLIGPSTNQREVRLGNWQKVLCTVLLITGQHCSVVLITWTAKASSVQYSTVQICWILPCTAVSTHIAIISLLAVSSDLI